MHVALFVTCLVDLMRPSVGFASIKLLQAAGCEVAVPNAQTCCGQPAYNNGDVANGRALARNVIRAFTAYPYVVVPSGSCAGMLRVHYPRLFAADSDWADEAASLARRTYELTEFLVDVAGYAPEGVSHDGRVAYHDSCASLREIGVEAQPRHLLGAVRDLELVSLPGAEECCGFGGTFCVKYPEISTHLVDARIEAVARSGADTLVGADLGCLLNIAGRLHRRDRPCRVFHVAELLADMTDRPAIAEIPAP
jgi:L-lactate dehydrogenase complex protein LldE